MKVFLEKMSICIGRLSKEGCPSQGRWAWSNLLKASGEQKVKEGWICFVCFSWNIHLLPSNLSSPGSQSFRLWLNYTTGFLGSLLGLHHCMSHEPILIINLLLYISIYPIGSISPENPDSHIGRCGSICRDYSTGEWSENPSQRSWLIKVHLWCPSYFSGPLP